MLANSIMQFLPEALLFAVADLQDFAFQSFASRDLSLQFLVCSTQLRRSLRDLYFQDPLRAAYLGNGCAIKLGPSLAPGVPNSESHFGFARETFQPFSRSQRLAERAYSFVHPG